jgi:hypothetical protein
MSKHFYDDLPYGNIEDKKIFLGGREKKEKLSDIYPTYRDRMTDFDDPENYNSIILDNTGKQKTNKCSKPTMDCDSNCDENNKDNNKAQHIQHFRKSRKPLCEHPLNTTYNEDAADLTSKGLMLGGTAVVAKGVADKLGGEYSKPIFTGATLVGAGVLIYKLTEQDIKKFYRNYISRLEGDYTNLISYNDYRQFVKKYNFKYEEDYYFLNDVLANRKDPIDMNKFMELNRYNMKAMNPYHNF